MDQRADKRFRVTGRKDISRLFKQGQRAGDGVLTVFAIPNDSPRRTRAAVAVSTRHGGAVRRNRIKRLCREAFRQTRDQLPDGWDFVIIPRVGAELDVDRLRASIGKLAGRAIQRTDTSNTDEQ